MNQPKPAIEQFQERTLRILGEYFPVAAPNPFKYANAANAFTLARSFPIDSFMPSDATFVTQAKIEIASGAIMPTAVWATAFLEFFNSEMGRSFKLDCNTEIFERALAGRRPSVELLTQIASEKASELVMTADASAQAAQGQRHEALFHKLAPKLITDIPAGSNRYAVALENKRIEERRQQIWDMSLEQLEELEVKRNLRSLPVSELRKIVNNAEPARLQKIVNGDRHQGAEPQAILDMRARAAEQVRMGIYRPLPAEFKIPGKEISVPWSHSLLAQLPADMTRKLLNLYGNDALTAACETQKLKLSMK